MQLLRHPAPLDVRRAIAESTLHFALVAALLLHVVPEPVFDHVQCEVVQVLQSATGIGNLVARLETGTAETVPAYARALSLVLSRGVLAKVAVPRFVPEVEKLLFRGRCLSVAAEAEKKHNIKFDGVLSNATAYGHFFAIELLSTDLDKTTKNSFLHSLLNVSPRVASAAMSCIFSRDFFDPSLFAHMRSHERKKMLLRFVQHMSGKDALAAYVQGRAIGNEWDEFMLESVIALCDYSANTLAALLVGDSELTMRMLQLWATSVKEPLTKQVYRTHLLACLCHQTSAAAVKNSTAFVEGVGAHLQSFSDTVKNLGIEFANYVCRESDSDQIFKDVTGLLYPEPSLCYRDIQLTLDESWDVLGAPTVELVEEAVSDLTIAPKEEPLIAEYDPSAHPKDPVPPPLYIKDLLDYFMTDTKDANAFEKQTVALAEAPTLILRKSAIGTEVGFYAEDLLRVLAGMTNTFDEATFDEKRLRAMIALVAAWPKLGTYACELLATGDYSLHQRMCILSSLSMAARQLRGYDESVHATPKMLPERLHKLYIAQELSETLQGTIQTRLLAGKIEKHRHKGSVSKTFFFPLVALWHRSGGVDIGDFTPILVAHYIRTLTLLMDAAYPCADYRTMALEFFEIAVPVLQNSLLEHLQVIESVATGSLFVLQTTESPLDFFSQLTVVENLIAGTWEALVDERVKLVCATYFIAMNSLRSKHERTLLSGINQGFI